MNNLELINYCEQALNNKWGYVWGTWGQELTEVLLNDLKSHYPSNINPFYDFIKSHYLGKNVTDCVGLIKGFYWNEKYNSNTDVSADEMLSLAKIKGSIDTIPEVKGILVCKTGHIGVYIGNGWVIEAHGTMYGVIKTPLRDGTPWTNWCQCPYIDYVKEDERVNKIVLYYGDFDVFSAIVVAQKEQCPCMKKSDYDTQHNFKADTIIQIGGILSDRYATFKDAGKYL